MRYNTPAAFRQALEERLRQRARETGEPLVRMRKRIVFERCMARLQGKPDNPWVVKGGFALELRLGMQARMTKDLDLGVDLGYFGGQIHTATDVALKLRQDLGKSMEDGLTFQVPSRGEHALPIPGVQAYRFTVEARLDGRQFETMTVDVGIGDPLIPPFDELNGSDLLSFADIPVVTIRATSRAQHFAEKVHALTRPFDDRVNTRVKDLADIMLLMNLGLSDPSAVMAAVTEVFDARKSHDIPQTIQNTPSTWGNSFAAMAKELSLDETTHDRATARLNEYWSKLPKSK
jgi:predicted nucleotidyltransferase component of viral defense system